MNLDRALAAQRDTVLIGVDGGASGFRAHEIVVRSTESGPRLAFGRHSAAEEIEPVPNFTPKSLERQRDEAARATFELSREERQLQGRWIHAASRAVWRVAALSGRDTVRVGVCAPGVKSADGRGIEVSLNGPRIPDFVDALEQSMTLDGLNLALPIERVISDGLACGLGENLAEEGGFADVGHAYYLGGGSGVAESYKVGGKVISADDLNGGLGKAWQLVADDGNSFEAHLSVAGLNRAFGLLSVVSPQAHGLPEEAAAAGNARAMELFTQRAERLAELCCARLESLHEAHGAILERIVIGQRLGLFFLDPRLENCLAKPARAALAARLKNRAPPALQSAWIQDGELRPGRLVGSKLRAASALGALALALEHD